MFQVEELSIQLIEALVPLMPRIKQRDKDLENQLRRAASSIGLNCAEAALSDPGIEERGCSRRRAAQTDAASVAAGGGLAARGGGGDGAGAEDCDDTLADDEGARTFGFLHALVARCAETTHCENFVLF
jgi:hypothetical protein